MREEARGKGDRLAGIWNLREKAEKPLSNPKSNSEHIFHDPKKITEKIFHEKTIDE